MQLDGLRAPAERVAHVLRMNFAQQAHGVGSMRLLGGGHRLRPVPKQNRARSELPDLACGEVNMPVSYTHLTLPTSDLV